MERDAMNQLLAWKDNPDRKPLILKGARQVGKTWLMQEFGKRYYANMIYLNFDEEEQLKSLFATNKNPRQLLRLLSLMNNAPIQPGKTLLIFDEVQECPEALNSLKYFHEQANEYHIVAVGSLLGTFLSAPKSYPVGQVNVLSLYPLDFGEFLAATDEALYAYYQQLAPHDEIPDLFHSRLLEAYHSYLIIGGMPECVHTWCKHNDPSRVAKLQADLLSVYEHDFTKYNHRINAARILMVFRSIVPQLAKENEKFSYGIVKPGARAREFEEAVDAFHFDASCVRDKILPCVSLPVQFLAQCLKCPALFHKSLLPSFLQLEIIRPIAIGALPRNLKIPPPSNGRWSCRWRRKCRPAPGDNRGRSRFGRLSVACANSIR